MMSWILVVEDDEILRAVLEDLFQEESISARFARHGREALELLHTHGSPALILTDLRMPTMSGWDFIEELRAHPHFGAVPVVVTSVDRAENLHTYEYLRKPYTYEQLQRMLAKYLSVRSAG